MLIGLDTNLETNHPFDFACGEVGDTQLESLSYVMDTPMIPEMKKIVFFHHHPFTHRDPFMELTDASRLARVLYQKANVVLFGHKHEMAKWDNRWGVKWVLASDNSPGKHVVGEVTIENGKITTDYISIDKNG